MGIILNIVGVGLIGMSLVFIILQKPQKAMTFAFLFMISDFNLNRYIDYNTITKLILLIILLFAVYQTRSFIYVKKRQLILFIFIFIAVLSYFENRSAQYSISDFILSLLTILLGVLAMHVVWDDVIKVKLLKVISWSSILCVFCGILKHGLLFTESGRIVSGTALYHSPAWMGIAGMFATMLLVEGCNCPQYNKFVIINFLLVCLTQMRGGTIYAIILITPFFLSQLKHMSHFKVAVFSILIPVVLFIGSEMLSVFMARTFVDGTINTSGRFEAWTYFIDLAKGDLLLGHGVGSIKTMTGTEIYKRGFTAAHNEYIRLLVETGVTGLVCFTMYMATSFKYIYINSMLQQKKSYLIAFILGFVVLSCLDNTISGHISWVPFCLLLSLSTQIESVSDNKGVM